MRKIQKIPPQTTFLPNIGQCSSRKYLKNTQHSTIKENLNLNRDRPNKISFQTSESCLSKKS